MRRSIALAGALLAAAMSLAEETGPVVVEADDDLIEEVIVTAPIPEVGQVAQLGYLLEIYDARRRGAELYKRGDYAGAFPYLLVAAKRGFKFAQARVGFLYQQGLGTDRDPWEAMAWFGVASRGNTMPEIRNYFDAMWEKIPEVYHADLSDMINEYESKYGTHANRVTCDKAHKAGTFIPKLTCRFIDDHLYQQTNQDLDALTAIEIPTVGS